MQTASLRPCRWARATSSASVSWSAWRLPSPVSGSTLGRGPARLAARRAASIAGPVWRAIASRVWKSLPATGGSSLRPNTVRNPRCPPSDSSGTAIADRIASARRAVAAVVVGDPDGPHPAAVRRAADGAGAGRCRVDGVEPGRRPTSALAVHLDG